MYIFRMDLPAKIFVVVAILIFDPKTLSDIGNVLRRFFQDASKEFELEFRKEAERLNETFQETDLLSWLDF